MTVKKTFSDLVFNDHPNNPNGVMATLDLGSGLGVSVVAVKSGSTGLGSYYGSVEDDTYEVLVSHEQNNLPLSPHDTVLGWQSPEEVTQLMLQLQTWTRWNFIAQLYQTKEEVRAELELD